MMKIRRIDNNDDGKPDVGLGAFHLDASQLKEQVRQAIAALEAQGLRDWQILSAWAEFLHERGDFEKGELLSMATQLLVEAEGRLKN